MIFDHIALIVSNQAKSKAFYSEALKPLGISIIMEVEECIGFGKNGKPSFWVCEHEKVQMPMHMAFAASDRKMVDAFYQAAIAAGGKNNGEPGLRKHYHPNYYAAFVIDPDGHNIEAVCHRAE